MNQAIDRILPPERDHSEFAKGLRVALFSGNYNCVRDGANQALNRLVAYLEGRGAAVRVYSPTVKHPAFEPSGTLISVPSLPIPRRSEYRLALGLTPRSLSDIKEFRPNIIHLSAPDLLGYEALKLANKQGIPVVASVHTRFETYFKYYGLGWLEGPIRRYLADFYNRCQHIYVPSDCMARLVRADGVTSEIRPWSRGVNRKCFNPARRDIEWRRALAIEDDDVVIAFVGRLVLEKGLGAFADALDNLAAHGINHRILVVGDGPARSYLEQRLPHAIYAGFLTGEELARAYASADIFFNPSSTEAFGNVTLEAMASGLPTVCAKATGSNSLVRDGVTGYLVYPSSGHAFEPPLRALITNPDLRRRMAAAGHAASEAYDWDAILATMVCHYRDALAARHAVDSASEVLLPLSAVTANSSIGKWSQ